MDRLPHFVCKRCGLCCSDTTVNGVDPAIIEKALAMSGLPPEKIAELTTIPTGSERGGTAGIGTREIKKIPVYPEEADRLEKAARRYGVPLRLMENNVIPDLKRKKILVLSYEIILDAANGYRCPFYDKDRGCTIHDIKPLTCRAYPLGIKEIDAFNREIFIDGACPGVKSLENMPDPPSAEDIARIFGNEYEAAVKLFGREKATVLKLKRMQLEGVINLPDSLTREEFDNALKNWEREDIYPDDD